MAARSRPRATSKIALGGYVAMEKSLDGLIVRAIELGDAKLAEDLEIVRRTVSARLI